MLLGNMEVEVLVDKTAVAHMEVVHMGAVDMGAACREVAVEFAQMGVVHKVLVHRVLVHRVFVHTGVVHRVFVHMLMTGMELGTGKGAAHMGDFGIGQLMQQLDMAGFDSESTVMSADRNLLVVGKVAVDMDGSQVVAAVVYYMAER